MLKKIRFAMIALGLAFAGSQCVTFAFATACGGSAFGTCADPAQKCLNTATSISSNYQCITPCGGSAFGTCMIQGQICINSAPAGSAANYSCVMPCNTKGGTYCPAGKTCNTTTKTVWLNGGIQCQQGSPNCTQTTVITSANCQ